MKITYYLLLFVSYFAIGQETLTTTILDKTPFNGDNVVSIDNFKTLFYTKDNTFIAQKAQGNLKYSNIQLGTITTVNTFNPLKINIFYKAFNTVIILDNRLAEIYRLDFNTVMPYKNVSHVSTGSDNTLWLFNQDLQILELFDYKINKTRAVTLPVKSKVLDMVSNYNNCWLLTENYLYAYNYFGSLLYKIENKGFTALKENNDNLILQKENALFYLNKETNTINPIAIPNLLIKQFFVTNEILYIYADEFLHRYQLKKK
ncbi:hypothetical protein [Pontimicrobium sp. MEBiC01747]